MEHPPNARYLTGFSGSAVLVLISADAAHLITDFRYEEQAAEEASEGVEVRVASERPTSELAELLEALSPASAVVFESDHVTVHRRERLEEECPGVEWRGVSGLVARWRQVKEPAEVERIEGAAEIADRVLEEVAGRADEGMEEQELAAELDYLARTYGSEGAPFETIVASGPRSSLPHARPSDRRLREGDLLLVDFGVRFDGYCCDVTRTFSLGSAGEWQREVHGAVLRAQEAAVQTAQPGTAAAEVDAAARAELAGAGLGDRFGHSTGHGVGLEVHEDPRLADSSDDRLAAGHVVTVEPGVYLPRRGGVRIEDVISVEEEGGRRVSGFSRRLREL